MKAKKITIMVCLVSSVLIQGLGFADSTKEKNHPRRDQVNDRIENQDKRISKEVKEGEITKQQAKELRKKDKNIRQEERSMARQDGGHLNKGEQRNLNQQLNQNSKEIGR